ALLDPSGIVTSWGLVLRIIWSLLIGQSFFIDPKGGKLIRYHRIRAQTPSAIGHKMLRQVNDWVGRPHGLLLTSDILCMLNFSYPAF
ncbi:MAG: hypothetical protein LW687_11675, partial [Burkholderiaceae bacterium]|nr:hypothetical protein [Burkholderiaceae bacterium]